MNKSDFIGLQQPSTGLIIHEEELSDVVRLQFEHDNVEAGGVFCRVFLREEKKYEKLVKFVRNPKSNRDNMRREARLAYEFAFKLEQER